MSFSDYNARCYKLTPLILANKLWDQLTDRPKQHQREKGMRMRREGQEGRKSVYFFLLNRLKRFSLSPFSRLPGLDSAAVVVATWAGSV